MAVRTTTKMSAISAVLSLLVLALWLFPAFWYRSPESPGSMYWLVERTNWLAGTFLEVPVSDTAERLLVADRTINGDFTRTDRRSVRFFSAKRFAEKANEIGLFMHTPDRCWTQVGWKVEAVQPEVFELDLHGHRLQFERRIFTYRGQRELVYFSGIVGGKPLPYRLDHNLSVARKFQSVERSDKTGAAVRATDTHFWARLWESFATRRELFGPKHFIRVSTPIDGSEIAEADQRLREFLPRWLQRGDYLEERARWSESGDSKADSVSEEAKLASAPDSRL